MDTIKSRIKIGFPKHKEAWTKARAIFGNHDLRIGGHPVMEDWETGYMKALADIATSKGGDILELGYGMGISARAIQAANIAGHYIIECHPDVIAKAQTDLREAIAINKAHILSGFWEDVTPKLQSGSFDGILFDTYPLTESEIHSNHFAFFKEAYRLLKPGGVLTYYSDEPLEFSTAHFEKLQEAGFQKANINHQVCNVDPPADCEYWQEKTIMAPIVTKD